MSKTSEDKKTPEDPKADIKNEVWRAYIEMVFHIFGNDKMKKALPECQPRLEEIFAIHLKTYTSIYRKKKSENDWKEFDEYVHLSLISSYFDVNDY